MKRNYDIERKYFDQLNFELFADKPGDVTLYSCPMCNEGGSYGKKHRFHWKFDIDNGNFSFVNCFNCGYGMDFEFFIRQFGGEESFKQLVREYKSSKGEFESYVEKYKLEEEMIQSPRTKDYIGLLDINKSKKALNYLKDRQLLDYKEHFLTDKYDNIVIPFYSRMKKIYGFQTRIISNKEFWFELEEINKKFRAWNFYNVNWEEPVYIFEGVEDALSSGLDNVIAVMGKYIHPFLMSKMKKPIICFDNDNDGTISMFKHVLRHNNASGLVYPKDFKYKDMNEMLLDNNTRENVKSFILNNIKQGFRLKVLAESLIR